MEKKSTPEKQNNRQEKETSALSTANVSKKNVSPVESPPVFVVDETFFRSRTPKATHWSIAWSDLMMTMFILFLTLFVYQLAHREFLSEESPEVIAGSSMPIPKTSMAPLPFHPISPVISNKKADKIKKLERVHVIDPDVDALFAEAEKTPTEAPSPQGEEEILSELPSNTIAEEIQPQPTEHPSPLGEEEILSELPRNTIAEEIQPQPAEQLPLIAEPSPLEPERDKDSIITQMYDLSKVTLTKEKLEKFASIELIPDKTMRIILTGDLLFPSGQAELTDQAQASLYKLIPIIEQTPYMINVIGHTDSTPMHSAQFSSNWELSTARASRVARFLIEQSNIPATQLVVAGYSYYRPVKPNTTAANRKANRRVEIILSQEPPPARTANQSTTQ